MATITELIHSLPPQAVYGGAVYHLNWSISQHDRRCIQICYRNEYDEVLGINSDYFFVEAEKHYATYTMLQMLLYYSEHVLSYIYYQDQDAYTSIVQSIYSNSVSLQNYCTVNPRTYDILSNVGYSTVIV